MKKKISMKTIYLLAVIAVGLVGLGVGSTYAVFTASATIDNPIAFTSNLSSTNEIIDTTSVNIGANETKTITLKVVNTTSSTLNYAAWYNADLEGLAIGVSSDSSSKATGTIAKGVTKAIDIIIKNGSTNTTTIQFGVSSSVDQISLGARMKAITNVIEPDKVSTTLILNAIGGLYSNDDSVDDGAGNVVDIDTTHYLMVDSFNNLRYFGTDPNNYVLFNCKEYPDTDCEVWRIVGIIDNKLRLMRTEPLEQPLSWDYDVDVNGSSSFQNDWENSTLFKFLNDAYMTGSQVVEYPTYDFGTITLDMSKLGLKNDETRNMLDFNEALWYLSSLDGLSLPPYPIYAEEHDNAYVLWNNFNVKGMPISIPYASDYGYAADLRQCTTSLDSYSSCVGGNWMASVFAPTTNAGLNTWLMTSYNDSSRTLAASIDTEYNVVTSAVRVGGAIYPTVYLNDGVLMVDGDGDGTASNPYKLYVG